MNWTIKIKNKAKKQTEKLPNAAKILNISQANLSAMENGRRVIGKELAKRIAEKFEIDYRIFL